MSECCPPFEQNYGPGEVAAASGVPSVQVDGEPPITTAVIFSEGTGITLAQVGDTITVSATGGGGGPPAPWTEANTVDPDDSRTYLTTSAPDAAANVNGLGVAFYGQQAVAGTGNGGGFKVVTGGAPGGTGGHVFFDIGGGLTQGGGFGVQCGNGTIGGNFFVGVGDGATRGKAIFIADVFEIHDQDDFSMIAGATKTEWYAKSLRTRGRLTVEDASGIVQDIAEACAPVTTTSVTPALLWSYAIGPSENVWVTIRAVGDRGSAAGSGAVAYTAQFRRAVLDNAGAAQQCGTTQDVSPAGGVATNGLVVTIALNGDTIEAYAVAPDGTPTLWGASVDGLAVTGAV